MGKHRRVVLFLVPVLFVVFVGSHEVAHAQNPQPRIEAYGSHAPAVLPQSSLLNLTVSLNNNGRVDNADWWFVAATPFGLFFLAPEGWTVAIAPAYQGPLFNLPPVGLNVPLSALPQGTYAFFFAVDTAMDGDVTFDRLYWDGIEINSSPNPAVPESDASKVTIPVVMYLLDRYFTDLPNKTDIDKNIAQVLNASPREGLDALFQALQGYKSLTEVEKNRRFDEATLLTVPQPAGILNIDQIRERLTRLDPLAMERIDKPAAPTALSAKNASSPEPVKYQIELTWQDNSSSEDGFHIYRSFNGAATPTLIATVGPGTTFFRDVLTTPSAEDDKYCYQVAAFRKLPPGYRMEHLESPPSGVACSFYAIGYPPVVWPDTDGDGVFDAVDKCPFVAGGVLGTEGCPDVDNDGVPDKDDYCPLAAGYIPLPGGGGPYAPQPGCPFKYRISWMGMKVLNNTAHMLWQGSPYAFTSFLDENGHLILHHTGSNAPVPPESPYLLFSWVNGMTSKGAKETGTARWCCGEDVDVSKGKDSEPDEDASGEEFPENLAAVRDHGVTVFPAFADDFAEIDEKHGLLMLVDLYKRNWSTTITPEKAELTLGTALTTVGATMGSIVGCVFSFGLGCVAGLVSSTASIVDMFLTAEGSQGPGVPVEVPDDKMGTNGWVISRYDAQSLTSKNGAYGFYFDMPSTFHSSCYPISGPCEPSWRYPIEMRARLYFCLYREGVKDSDVKSLCSTYADENVNVK